MKSNESVTRASYEISYLLAKHSKPLTDCSLVKDYMINTSKYVCPEKMQLFGDISLSRNMVSDTTNEMADNLSEQLSEIFATVLCLQLIKVQTYKISDKLLCSFVILMKI